jgi:hypothetical protein
MLLHIDGEVVEIRPSELFESKTLVTSRNLELVTEPTKKKKKATKKVAAPKTFIEDSYGNSSST